ncbi:MAG TPA: EI24 domain-containing protein [Micromonosporaceae bacterium]|nr:EI24 domain-containing protein [Micromonosporaceae bacterium]
MEETHPRPPAASWPDPAADPLMGTDPLAGADWDDWDAPVLDQVAKRARRPWLMAATRGGHPTVAGRSLRKHGQAVATRSAAVAGMAARGAAGATHRGWAGIRCFLAGAGCLGRGVWCFLTTPLLWLLALVPVVAVHLTMLTIEQGTSWLAGRLTEWASQYVDAWPALLTTVLAFLVEYSVVAMVNAAVAFVLLPIGVVFGAACYVQMARTVEQKLGVEADADPPAWYRAAGLAIRQTALILIIINVGWLLIVPLVLIPGVGVVAATGLVLLLESFFVAVLTLAIPLHHRGVRNLRTQLRYAWSHLAYVTGFGMISILVLMIPAQPLRWLTVPSIFVGAVLLYRRVEGLPVTITRHGEPAPAGIATGALPAAATVEAEHAPTHPTWTDGYDL